MPLYNPSSGSTPPGGLNTYIQFNDSSTFGGDADLAWNKTTNVQTVNGTGNFATGIGAGKTRAGNASIEAAASTTMQGLQVENANTTDISFSSFKTADSYVRFTFLCDGKMEWGPGNVVADTNLYRSAANSLKTDDSLEVAGTLKVASLSGVLKASTGTVSAANVVESEITLADNTTNDVSTTKHGFVPKAPNDTSKYLRGDATWQSVVASGGATTVKLTGDLASTTSTTLADTTGLNFSVTAGTYYNFRFFLLYQSAATTTGVKLSLTHGGATTFVAVAKTPVSTAAGGTASEFGDWITSSGDAVIGTGTPGAGATHFAIIDGMILPSSNGTLQVQHATEVGTSGVTIKQGSHGLLWSL